MHNKKILIVPLDWGLGHATRCLVIIQHLLLINCIVTVAASGKIKALLQKEFPNLTFLDLPGYKISYSKSKRILPLKILAQIPKILKIISFENKWLKDAIATHRFDAVISDNRFGLYTKSIKSVFITHQLHIKTNFSWLDKILQRLNYSYINRFNECWVPDFEGNLNIAGELSHPKKLPAIPVKYLGTISRFSKQDIQKPVFKWMVIMSGPEPQRTMLEERIFQTVTITNEDFLIVRGLPGEAGIKNYPPNCKVHNHLNTADMLHAIKASEFIVSRCGYTTVMEILSLQKKSVLIPTPGQTEQEYLAKHLSKQNWCYTFKQDEDFVLHLENAKTFAYALPELKMDLYKKSLADFVSSLQT